MITDTGDVQFRHFTAKHRIISWVSRNFFDNLTYTVRHGLLTGLKRKGGLGWLPASLTGNLDTPEIHFWRSLDLGQKVVYDIGAFHGLLTLFFASQAKTVVSFEPNTRNYTRLMENIRLNGLTNVTVRKIAVGSKPGRSLMAFSPLMPGGATVDSSAQTVRKNIGLLTETVEITTLDKDIAEVPLPPPDFIKIDTEGFELEALRGAAATLATFRPSLFLEMHGETMNQKRIKVAEIVTFLEQAGYSDIRHIESGTSITSANTEIAVQGHLYCPAGPL